MAAARRGRHGDRGTRPDGGAGPTRRRYSLGTVVKVPGASTAGTLDASYARAVGERLRQVRQRRRLTLHGVERLSAREFKASVLGAYERGERVISVARLQRLSVLYDVAVDALLPGPGPGSAFGGTGGAGASAGDGQGDGERAERLAAIAARDPELLDRYLRMVRSRRRGPEGAAITIRAEDVGAMELLLGTPAPPPPPPPPPPPAPS